MYFEIERLILNGLYDQATAKLNSEDYPSSSFYKARIHEIKGEYTHGLDEISLFESSKRPNYTDYKPIFMILKALFLEKLGKFEESKTLVKNAFDLSLGSSLPDYFKEYYELTGYYLEGENHRENGSHELARKSFMRLRDIAQDKDNQFFLTLAIRGIGVTYTSLGEVIRGQEFYHEALKIAVKNNDLYNLGLLYNSLGIAPWILKHYEESFSYYNKGLQIWRKIGNKLEEAKALLNIGANHRELYDFEQAKKLLTESREMQKELGRDLDESFSLFELFQIAIYENQIEDINGIIERLKFLSDYNSNTYIDLHYKLSLATKYKTLGNPREREEAKQIFQDIENMPIVGYHLTIYALKMTCEILLDELEENPDPQITERLSNLLELMRSYTDKFHFYADTVETMLYQSHLEIIKGNLDGSMFLLDQALEITEKYNFQRLKLQVDIAKGSLEREITKIMDIVKQNTSITDWVKNVYMKEYVTSLGVDITPIPKVQNEIPIMLFIVSINGNIRFTYEFNQMAKANPNLIASFISAVNSFFTQTFSSEGIIDSIQHKDYTINLDSFNNLIFCYIYKGRSVDAEWKLRKVRDAMISSEKIAKILSDNQFLMLEKTEEIRQILEVIEETEI